MKEHYLSLNQVKIDDGFLMKQERSKYYLGATRMVRDIKDMSSTYSKKYTILGAIVMNLDYNPTQYSRKSRRVTEYLAVIGGLASLFFNGASVLYGVLAEPFNFLHKAQTFSKLKEDILEEKKDFSVSKSFKSKMNDLSLKASCMYFLKFKSVSLYERIFGQNHELNEEVDLSISLVDDYKYHLSLKSFISQEELEVDIHMNKKKAEKSLTLLKKLQSTVKDKVLKQIEENKKMINKNKKKIFTNTQ